MQKIAIVLVVVVGAVLAAFCAQTEEPWAIDKVVYPDDNPDSDASVTLGGELFFESMLSQDSSISCQSCHMLTEALADHLPLGMGIKNRTVTRNTPSLFNVGLHPYFMMDGKFATLEEQVLGPINDHREFDLNPEELLVRLNRISIYNEMSQKAYGEDLTIEIVQKALGNFQRALISQNSDFDVFMRGNPDALSDSAKRGWALFISDELNCTACHGGFVFTDYSFQNNGYFETYQDSGRALISGLDEDHAKFKVPSLRNVALTFPYMHNGSVETLAEVIDKYADGETHPLQSEHIRQFSLDLSQKADLLVFFGSLTEIRLTAED
ncbi:MAG: cytochrome c peroxidase [Litorivivens sp.]|jgi:cytochrome c peroxidase